MGRLKTVPVNIETVIDADTGQVLDQKVITREILVKDAEEWFNTYAKLIRSLFNLDGNEVKVLFWCALAATVNTNEIVLPRLIKQRMGAETGLSIGSIENALGRLVNKGFLHRLGRGVYHLDPDSTWRGDLKARAKNIQVFLNYTIAQP
jgi:hypothetical protein